ncbi:transcriptional regulator of acetoin/glycerol metabolism [Nocardioides sp. BE266]|uniref:GAF domain-containing protein n=1 Tax=Nocardioides sp. BE266 TaxID=2817725 RepID=UPI00285BEA5F|nr:GAF domain-containing protein [Nocardioides sp. BE266]MDR7255441.1 transcriptional regulator of acetoin/glycerol metabolism [Nocardioides sp. BE266]
MADGGLPERALRHREVQRSLPGAVVDAEPASLSERLVASWQRSEDYGVSLEEIEPRFTGTVNDESLFFECGREVLADLHATLVNEPVSLMLTDAEGLVLNRMSGDNALLRALDKVHLAPGFGYAERTVGTNGLGLAIADRAPTVVRADEHYSLSLCSYTCAAVPVLDPLSGQLEGCVNLTTWSSQSSELLLALAQSAASTTSALMLARSRGQRPRPAQRGEVFRVETPRLEPGAGALAALGSQWTDAVAHAAAAMRDGRIVAAVGEDGAGRSTLLAQAMRQAFPRERILAASPPAPQDSEAWIGLWTPELGKPDTGILVRDVDLLPAWVAEHVRDLVLQARVRAMEGERVPFCLTAGGLDTVPPALAPLVETVVAVPPLRERSGDVVPLAHHVAHRVRGREVTITPAAETALRGCGWPGNVRQLAQEVTHAARLTDTIDVRHLSADVLSGSSRRLTRIETFERDEIVRVLMRPGISMQEAGSELGMSRATVYRKLAQYDIHVPRAGS